MRTIGIILGTLAALLIGAVFFIEVIAPSLNWSATAEPGMVEEYLADRVIDGWVGRKSGGQENPLPATPQNLKTAQDDYREHCAGCHALDGSGRNEFGAQFYPPVANLREDESQMTDAQLYFIIAKGIRYSGMPSFETHHSREEIWRFVLWVRHLSRMSPDERAAIVSEMNSMRNKNTNMAH